MSWMKRIVLVMAVVASSGVSAWRCRSFLQSLSCDDWCGSVEVIGEYLWMRPHTCDLDYVILDSRAVSTDVDENLSQIPQGKLRAICPQFDSAFRAGAAWLTNERCNDLTMVYTRVSTRDHDRVVPEGLEGIWMTFGDPRYMVNRLNNTIFPGFVFQIPAEATENVGMEYNSIDGVWGWRRREGCRLWIRAFVGLRWADLCLRKSARYQGTTESLVLPNEYAITIQEHEVSAKTTTWGIGPRIGIDLRYAVCRGCLGTLGIAGRLGASMLAGEGQELKRQRDVIFSIDNGPPVLLIDQPLEVTVNNNCYFFPELDGRIGLNYLVCWQRCLSVALEIGWEVTTYIDALPRLRFNDTAGTSRIQCQDFTLNGLYVSAKVSI